MRRLSNIHYINFIQIDFIITNVKIDLINIKYVYILPIINDMSREIRGLLKVPLGKQEVMI